MQKVISINLNGNAYQLDETGYDALHQYLASAERALANNPDRVEIMADLEQAIADKCQKFLGPNKSVVTAAEVGQIVKEMGPIDPPQDEAGEGTVYPLLSRLKKEGYVTTRWRESDAGPPRKYYEITRDGRTALAGFTDQWRVFRDAVDDLLSKEGT